MKTVEQLFQQEQLPAEFVTTVLPHYQQLANYLGQQQPEQDCLLVAINGAQGTGKSTLALFLKVLLHERGLNTAILSIDDLYLTRQQRQTLAQDIHPLFITRGVPGTHDLILGQSVINQLRELKKSDVNHVMEVKIPRFDKAQDERCPESEWSIVNNPVDVIILEGWCVSARPMTAARLAQSPNKLEQEEDPQCAWRNYLNERLSTEYQDFFSQFDKLIMLKAPGFGCVKQWRALQEYKLSENIQTSARENLNRVSECTIESPTSFKGLMDENKLDRFIMHYERLTKHTLEEMPQRADVVLELNEKHQITQARYQS